MKANATYRFGCNITTLTGFNLYHISPLKDPLMKPAEKKTNPYVTKPGGRIGSGNQIQADIQVRPEAMQQFKTQHCLSFSHTHPHTQIS